MIEELTKENLEKYGFTSESIEGLTEWDNYEIPHFEGDKCFFASNIVNRIYSGIDAARRYFIENKNGVAFPYTEPDLIPEYFKKSLSVYIEAQRKIAGAIFIEIDTIKDFKENEIIITQKKIKEYEAQPPVFSSFGEKINLYKHYLKWLNNLNDSEMITDKIQALFKFIDFLYLNIANFKKCDIVISQLILLKREISNFRSFADKNKFDELQLTSNNKLKEIDDNIIHLMKSKVIELKIYDLGDTSTFRKWNSQAIGDLKKNYSKEDAPIIIQHQKKYFEFKTEINFAYFEAYLPQDFKELFDLLFDESKVNEDEIKEGKVNEDEPDNNITPEHMRTIKTIEEMLNGIDVNKGYSYAFRKDKDFNVFVEVLANYFQDKDFKKPQEIITLNTGSKTRLAPILKGIYKKLIMSEAPLKSNSSYFELLRVLKHYQNKTDNQIYTDINR